MDWLRSILLIYLTLKKKGNYSLQYNDSMMLERP